MVIGVECGAIFVDSLLMCERGGPRFLSALNFLVVGSMFSKEFFVGFSWLRFGRVVLSGVASPTMISSIARLMGGKETIFGISAPVTLLEGLVA